MANLASLSNLRIENTNSYGADALALIMQNSPLIRFLDSQSAFELDATTFNFLPAENAANLQGRDLGEGYTDQAIVPGSAQTGSLYFMGDSVKVDRTHVADAAKGLRDMDTHFAKMLQSRISNFAKALDTRFMNGTGAGDPVQLKGLKTILNGTDNMPGLGITGVINAKNYAPGTGNVTFDLGNTTSAWNRFIEVFSLWIDEVESPTGILANKKFIARLTSMAHKERRIDITTDAFGNRVTTFDGIPLVEMREESIATNEPDDTPSEALTNTTSIYIVSPGEQRFSVVTNSGLEWIDYEKEVAGLSSEGYTWEIRAAWKIEEKHSVRRVRNIKL